MRGKEQGINFANMREVVHLNEGSNGNDKSI